MTSHMTRKFAVQLFRHYVIILHSLKKKENKQPGFLIMVRKKRGLRFRRRKDLQHSFIILKIVQACSVYTLYNTSGYPKSKVSVNSSLNSHHYNISNAGFSWFQSILGEKQYYKPKHGNYPQLRARKCDQKL